MINTFFGLDALSSSAAMAAAFVIGLPSAFPWNRRVSAVHADWRPSSTSGYDGVEGYVYGGACGDVGLQYASGLGSSRKSRCFFMPSIYGAQIVGGLIFGVGFVMGAWCPGTAAVGLASGRLDALVFLAGAGSGASSLTSCSAL